MSTIAPDDELRPGSLLAERYRLVQLIERNELSEVWEAEDEILTRAVAAKVLRPDRAGDDRVREDFRRDAVAAARLVHPNVVATFDTGTAGGVTYLVMELVRGRNLRQVLTERGCLSPSEAVVVGAQVARAVDHAHRAGLTHRAIGAGNVLLCDDGSWPGRVKVSDFRRAPAPVGTVQPGAARQEVAAIGELLHELLCGEPPPATGPPRLRRRRAGIPRSLETVVARALDRDASGFASAGELAEALEAIELDDDADPMVRREPTPPAGVPTVVRQARRSVVPLVLLVLAAAAGIALAATLIPSGGNGRGPGGTAAGGPVLISSVKSFDPEGPDHREHDELANLVIDGDASTAWRTETYQQRGFGKKKGVGLVLRLDHVSELGRLQVTSSNQGWSAEVYVADAAPDTLDGWGAPVAVGHGFTGDATFDLHDREGGVVLLWLTDPGAGNRGSIAEVALQAA